MKYGLIGEKLGHSFSPEIHKRLDSWDYTLKELGPQELEDFFRERDFDAINITMPYKETVIKHLDFISEDAKIIGAVNTVVNEKGKLYGYNTDIYGLTRLVERTAGSVYGKKVLVLGTGGTAKTACEAVKRMGASTVQKVGRRGDNGSCTYSEAYEKHFDADILINTTPVGMYPRNDETPMDLDAFTNLSAVVDVIFNPLNTVLMQKAEAKNIAASNGLFMLVCQAVAASSLFVKKDYPQDTCEKIFREIVLEKTNIVLTGMPGSGKTTVGGLLSSFTGHTLYDTDKEIVRETGMEISEIFKTKGEEYFRDLETQVIKKLSVKNGVIISCGGGAVLRDQNVDLLKQNGRVYFLDRPLEKLVPTADRPLASDRESIRRRYEERIHIYNSTCHKRICAAESAEKVAEAIGKDIEK